MGGKSRRRPSARQSEDWRETRKILLWMIGVLTTTLCALLMWCAGRH